MRSQPSRRTSRVTDTSDERLRRLAANSVPPGRARRAEQPPSWFGDEADALATQVLDDDFTVWDDQPTGGFDDWTGSPQQLPAAQQAADPSVARRLRQFSSRHLAAVGLVLVIAVVFVLFQTTRASSHPLSGPTTPTVSRVSTPTPKASTPVSLRVHVIGAVRSPGVVAIAPGARIIDAIEAAGGLADDADIGDLNLAAVVADGTQIVIGTKGGPGTTVRPQNAGQPGQQPPGSQPSGPQPPGSPESGQAKLNLNTATQAQLEDLPGVGPVTAKAILSWRIEHGRFSRIEELQEVDGIGPKTFAKLAPHVTV